MRHPTSLAFLLLAVLVLAGCGAPSSATPTPSPTAPIPSLSVYGASSAEGTVTALNASTGLQRWKVQPAGQGNIRLVAVNHSVLYLTVWDITTYPRTFQLDALNTRDGSLRWSYQRTGAGDVLALDQGILYGTVIDWTNDPTLHNEVYALNADTGTVLWDTPIQGTGYIDGVLANGTLAVASTSRSGATPHATYLYGLDATTGAITWQKRAQQPLAGVEAISGDTLYVSEIYPDGGTALTLLALEAATGAERWQQTASFIAATDTGVFAEVEQDASSTVSVCFTELSRTDGAQIWRAPSNETPPLSRPLFDSGALYVASAANVVAAFSTTDGSRLWQSSPVPGQARSSTLTVSHGTVYAALEGVGLLALNAPDGKLLWQDTPGAKVIAVQHGTLYGLAPNEIVALNTSTGAVQWQDTSAFSSAVLG